MAAVLANPSISQRIVMAVILAGVLSLIAAGGGVRLDATLLAGAFVWALLLVFGGFGLARTMRQRH